MKVEDVEGIGPAGAAKLQAAGVHTTDALRERARTRRGREELAGATGLSPKHILEWANHVDLMRLDGVGPEFADLLEAAGVDSPAELAQRNAANLAGHLAEVNQSKHLTRRVPSQEMVQGWISAAKSMPRAIEH